MSETLVFEGNHHCENCVLSGVPCIERTDVAGAMLIKSGDMAKSRKIEYLMLNLG